MRVRGCNTLDELYLVLRDIGEIKGSRQTYTPDKLIEAIKNVEKLATDSPGAARSGLEYITNTYGIRDTVRRLVLHERE